MFLGRDEFVWWMGVVEDNEDPDKLGRLKVRIFGYHPPKNTNKVPTTDLPWATVVVSASLPGAYARLDIGEWVFGFFIDGKDAQEPAVLGWIPSKSRSALGGWSDDKDPSYPHVDDVNKDGIAIRLKEGATLQLRNDFSSDYGAAAIGSYYNGKFNGYRVEYIPRTRSWFGSNEKIVNGFTDHNGASIEIQSPGVAGPNSQINAYAKGTGDIRIQAQNGNTYLYNERSGAQIAIYNSGFVALNATSGQDVYASGPGGGWNVTRTLRNHEDRIRNIEFPPPPPPSDGGDCFTADSLVTMAGGHTVKISKVQVGDFILSSDKKTLNKVKFIEAIEDTVWDFLYSPDDEHEPFATINHPLYINGIMHSPDPDATANLYPWLEKCEKFDKVRLKPAKGELVYNLWVDGDHTYIVNGYATHSIMDDGGFLAKAWNYGLLSHKQVMDIMFEFTTNGNDIQYGAYLLNKLVGMSDSHAIIKYFSNVMSADNSYLPKRILLLAMRITSKLFKVKSFIA
jgi:hypothetical protein